MKLIYILAIITVVSFSCYYDSEESLYPNIVPCDTNNVTYSGKILPLLENNCLSCHSSSVASSKGGKINLQGYQNVVDNATSIQGDIKWDGQNHNMPKNTSQLQDCLIQQFDIWVNAGTPQN